MSHEAHGRGVKRRDFLKIVGVTGAAATTVGCTSEEVGKLNGKLNYTYGGTI